MVYNNRGGHIRKRDTWSKATANESATRVHQLALEDGAEIVVIDAAGLGGPILDQIAARGDRYYTIIAALGNEKSPDLTRWANARAYWYDMLRQQMLQGLIDLDLFEDRQLYDELLMVQFDFTLRGALKIESKKDMAKRGVKSPDALDAVVYSAMHAREMVEDPLAGLKPGTIVQEDPWLSIESMAGLPM
jgi:hypothetical protein